MHFTAAIMALTAGLLHALHSRHLGPRGPVAYYLTRSMTRSLGAALTASSLIMTISSPGMSLPSEGPPAQEVQFRVWRARAHVLKALVCARLKSLIISDS